VRPVELLIAGAVTLTVPAASLGQDTNILLPVPEIERMFRESSFDIISMIPSRGLPTERTYQATARFEDGEMIKMKYAPASKGAEEFNNEPRYELAAYEIQKLFLDPGDYVVPPTVGRCLPLDDVQAAVAKAPSADLIVPPAPTFGEWNMGYVVLQYWLWNVEVPDPRKLNDGHRLRDDDAYARHMSHFNLLTYLIRHSDSNEGNFLLSSDPDNPRVFSVDNGVAFRSEESDRGHYWRELRLKRYPREAIERLRAYSLEDLYDRLGVVAQYELSGARFVQTEPTENLDPDKGVRRNATTIQFGLTASEIRSVHDRLTDLLEDVDRGKYEVF